MEIGTSKLPEEIKVAWDRNELVVFIGAGISRLAGCKGWDELAYNLIDGVFSFKEKQQILSIIKNNKELITIAYKEYCNKKKEEEFYNRFEKSLDVGEIAGDNIYHLIKKFNCLFLTTNADGILEKVLPKHSWSRECTLEKLEEYERGGFVFYLHGRYKDKTKEDKESLVFTVDQYLKKYSNPDFLMFLEEVFTRKTVLFLGYGLSEFELLDHLFTKISLKDKRRRFFVLEGFCSGYEALRDARKSYYESLGVELLEYIQDDKGYDEQYDIIQKWINELRSQTFYNSENILQVDKAMKEYSHKSIEDLIYYLSLDNENKILYNEIMKNIARSEQYDKWLDFLEEQGLLEIKYCPVVKKTIDGYIQGEYWSVLQMLLELLEKHSKDLKLNLRIQAIIEELSQAIIKNEDLKLNWHLYHDIALITFKLDIEIVPMAILKYLAIAREAKMYNLGYYLDESNYSINKWDDSSWKEVLNILLDSYKGLKRWDEEGILHEGLYRRLTHNLLPKINESKKRILLEVAICYFKNVEKVNRAIMRDDIETFMNAYRYTYRYISCLVILIRETCKITEGEYIDCKLRELINSDNEYVIKLVMYLVVQLDIDYKIILENEEILNKVNTYSDFYIYLEKYASQFRISDINIILMMIKDAGFGINKEGPYELKRIKSMKAALYKILSSVNDEAKKEYEVLAKEDIWKINPHDDQYKEVEWKNAKSEEFIDEKVLAKKNKKDKLQYIKEIFIERKNSYGHRTDLAEQLVRLINEEEGSVQEIFEELPGELISNIYQRLRGEDKQECSNTELYRSKGNVILEHLKGDTLDEANRDCIRNILLYLDKVANDIRHRRDIVEKCWMFLCNNQGTMDDRYNNSELEIAVLNTYQGSIGFYLIKNLVDIYCIDKEDKSIDDYLQKITQEIDQNTWLRYALAMQLQNLYYINWEWTKKNLRKIVCFNDEIDISAIRLAIGHVNYVYEDLVQLMVEKQIWLHYRECNWKGDKEHISEFIQRVISYMVLAYLFNQCDLSVVKKMINTMESDEYIELFKAINQKIVYQHKINYGQVFVQIYNTIECQKKELNKDTYLEIIEATKNIDTVTQRVWEILQKCFKELKNKNVYWHEIEDVLQHWMEKQDKNEFYKMVFEILNIIDDTPPYYKIEVIIRELEGNGLKEEARKVCNLLITQGKLVDKMVEWSSRLRD